MVAWFCSTFIHVSIEVCVVVTGYFRLSAYQNCLSLYKSGIKV